MDNPFSVFDAAKELMKRKRANEQAQKQADKDKKDEDANQYGDGGHNRSGNYNK